MRSVSRRYRVAIHRAGELRGRKRFATLCRAKTSGGMGDAVTRSGSKSMGVTNPHPDCVSNDAHGGIILDLVPDPRSLELKLRTT